MQRIRGMANNGMWMGVLALATTMTFTGAAVAQKKSSGSTSTSKPAAAPQKAPAQAPKQPPPQQQRPQQQGQQRQQGQQQQGQRQQQGQGQQQQGKGPVNQPRLPSAHEVMNSPHPPVGTTRTANGVVRVDPNGTRTQYNAQNRPVVMQKSNLIARYDQRGKPSSVRTLNPTTSTLQVVHHGPGGIRTAEVVRPASGPGGGMERVVSRGPRNGYLERPVYGRSGFVRRSYLVGDRRYAVIYRGYRYNGVAFYRPVPVVIYSPGYYGWAYQSWGAPVVIDVGFVSQPWYGSYGRTFVPYDQYASADEWMTDQILASNMQAAYDAGREAGAQQNASGDVPLAPPTISPELKQQFDAQVKQEIQEQGQEAQGGVGGVVPPPATDNEPEEVPDALKPGHTVFRVVATLDVDSDGDSCTLNADDWIVRNGIMNEKGMVTVTVAASRSTDCAQGATTEIPLNDLMTMENEQDQQIKNMLQLASLKMGKGGMPAGPPAGATPVPGGQAQPDVDLASNLQKEQVDANAAEAQATAPPAPGGQ